MDNKQLKIRFYKSIVNFDEEEFKSCLAEGADVNTTNAAGLSPLHVASFYGNTEFATTLIGKGAKIDAVDSKKKTALHWATAGGHLETARALYKQDPNLLEAQDIFGFTPLHTAVSRNWIDITKYFIKQGANVNALTVNGDTPLHLAANEGGAETAKLLVDAGATPDIKNRFGWTAKYNAHTFEHYAVESIINEAISANEGPSA